MSYTPPRGPCSQKLSIMSTCACYRFMVHPLKAATSFDCDGCGHHASFHQMENPAEEEAASRWRAQAEREEKNKRDEGSPTPKRRRITNGNGVQQRGGGGSDAELFRQLMSNGSRKQNKTPSERADADFIPDDPEELSLSGRWKSPLDVVQRR